MNGLSQLSRIRKGKTGRVSSWDLSGRNADFQLLKPGERRTLADIKGPGIITHIWMTQPNHYRECLLRITWDDARAPSVLCPLGDFFGLGHGIVNSYESMLFSASTKDNNRFNAPCALNCYAPMPFRKRAHVELLNESDEIHCQYFYVDYEQYDALPEDTGYFHAEFRRENPFGGWGGEISVNWPESNAVNRERTAWTDNYVILETKGEGHYIGCNLSVTNYRGGWWGEGDDMIWVDGYKWPPDLHGTGSEDYLNQAYGMQTNAFLRNGTSIHERETDGYQTSYVHHLENPVRFTRDIKVTIEHGHANHLCNEMSSTAYWYTKQPAKACRLMPVAQRMPAVRNSRGKWIVDKKSRHTTKVVTVNNERMRLKKNWAKRVRDMKHVTWLIGT